MKKNIFDTYGDMSEHWSPRTVAEANGQSVKLAKISGEFDWHHHSNEDEIFMVMKGSVTIQYKDRDDMVLNEGDIHTVPMGIEHCPKADEECWIILFEPSETAHTGNVITDKTKSIEEQRAHLTA